MDPGAASEDLRAPGGRDSAKTQGRSDVQAGAPGDAKPDLGRLKRYFSEHEQLTADARRHSLRAIDYYDSDQYTPEEACTLGERGQPAIVINRIKPAINGMVGVAERGRSDPQCWPRNPGGEDAADAATDALRYIADFNRFRRLKLDVFRDMLVPGSGACLVGADGDKNVTLTQIRWEEFGSTGYQFNLDQGLNAVTQSKAASGLLGSGSTLTALDNYATGLADSYGQQYESNLQGVASTGQAAASGLAGEGQSYANAVSSNNNSAASASGNAALSGANAFSGLLGNALQGYGLTLGQSSFGGGGNAMTTAGSGIGVGG